MYFLFFLFSFALLDGRLVSVLVCLLVHNTCVCLLWFNARFWGLWGFQGRKVSPIGRLTGQGHRLWSGVASKGPGRGSPSSICYHLFFPTESLFLAASKKFFKETADSTHTALAASSQHNKVDVETLTRPSVKQEKREHVVGKKPFQHPFGWGKCVCEGVGVLLSVPPPPLTAMACPPRRPSCLASALLTNFSFHFYVHW